MNRRYKVFIFFKYGDIQQLLGQVKGGRLEGGGGSRKSMLVHLGEGGSLEYPSEPKSKKRSSISR